MEKRICSGIAVQVLAVVSIICVLADMTFRMPYENSLVPNTAYISCLGSYSALGSYTQRYWSCQSVSKRIQGYLRKIYHANPLKKERVALVDSIIERLQDTDRYPGKEIENGLVIRHAENYRHERKRQTTTRSTFIMGASGLAVGHPPRHI